MDQSAAHDLRACLARDETLVWAGRPDPLRYALHGLGRRLAIALPATLLLLAAVAWLATGHGTWPAGAGTRAGMVVAAMPLIYLGLRALLQPLERMREAAHVAYGLTGRRAVTLVGGSRSRIENVPPERFRTPVLTRHRNGTATVLFVDENPPTLQGGSSPSHPGFVGVRDASGLARLIETAIAERDRPETTSA